MNDVLVARRAAPFRVIFGWSSGWRYGTPTLISALTVTLVLAPLLTMVMFSLRTGTPWAPGPLTFANYLGAYGSAQTYEVFLNTAWLAAASTVVSVAIAIVFAFLTERTNLPFRNVAWGLMLIPMAMPGILFAVSWTFLLSPRIGVFNVWIRELAGLFGILLDRQGPLNIYSLPGMIFLEGMRGVTTTFLIMVGAFRAMDPSLEEAGRASGASPLTTFARVTIPMLSPAILAAAIYSFMTHLESLEIPLVIGLPAKVYVFPTYIYFTTQRFTPPQYGLSAALSMAFVVASVFLLYAYRRITNRSNRFATVTGKGFRPRTVDLGRWRFPLFAVFVLYFVLTIGAPTLILGWVSLLPFPMAPSWELFNSLTLRNYTRMFGTPEIWQAFTNTIVVAAGAATVTIALSLATAWVSVRMKSRFAGFVDTMAFLPHALPGVVIGISLILITFVPVVRELQLYGTSTIIVLGLTISFLAFGNRSMASALSQIHTDMEEASRASGVKWWPTMTRIVAPLLLPALVSGWIWVATHAVRNVSIPLLLAGQDNKVISVVLWHSWDDGYPGLASAIGVLLMVGLGVVTVAGRLLVAKFAYTEQH